MIIKFKYFFLLFFSYFFIEQINIISLKAQNNQNSIIKLFCVENVRSQMLRANLEYDQNIALETCNCYLENLEENYSHQESVSKCKKQNQNKFILK